MRMLDYPSLAAVAAVVREGSFERAARALNVTPSAISQRVKQLEERLGSVLIIRGQPCTATATGRLLCSHMEHVGLLEQELRGAASEAGASRGDRRTHHTTHSGECGQPCDLVHRRPGAIHCA